MKWVNIWFMDSSKNKQITQIEKHINLKV